MPSDNGGMAAPKQSWTLVAMVCLLFLTDTSSVSSQTEGNQTGDELNSQGRVEIATDVQLTEEQQELRDFASRRFAGQGLTLPQVEVEFYPNTLECDGHKGLYWSRNRSLRMCSLDKRTMLHELAHAWANLHLTDAQRERFAELRGLEVWNDPKHDWEERATEHAAEIIAWALMDEPIHVRYVAENASGRRHVEYRLLTIEESGVEKMCELFVTLTGRQLVYRDTEECDSELLEVEWQARMITASSSPEARGH
jgi:hypothetical protein